MVSFVGKLEADECGIGVNAPANSQLYIGSAKITRTGIAVLIGDETHKDETHKKDINIKDMDIKNIVKELQAYEAGKYKDD